MVRVLGPTFSTLFMFRDRVRVISGCDVTLIISSDMNSKVQTVK